MTHAKRTGRNSRTIRSANVDRSNGSVVTRQVLTANSKLLDSLKKNLLMPQAFEAGNNTLARPYAAYRNPLSWGGIKGPLLCKVLGIGPNTAKREDRMTTRQPD